MGYCKQTMMATFKFKKGNINKVHRLLFVNEKEIKWNYFLRN